MQLRLLLVPLLAALPCSCTTPNTEDHAAAPPIEVTSTAPPSQTEADSVALSASQPSGQPSETADVQDTAAGTQDSAGMTPNQDPAQDQAAAMPASAARQDPNQGAGDFQEDAVKLARQKEQRAFMANEYLKEGDRKLERGDLHGSLTSYSTALEMDPTNQSVREKMRKVQALLGDQFAEGSDVLGEATEQEIVRRAQARMTAEDARIKAKNALAQGDFDTAIEQYRQAELILRYNPMIAAPGFDAQIVAGELETAVRMAEEASSAANAQAQQLAAEAREKKEREEAAYRDNKIRSLLTDANNAFLSENYARAEALTSQVLLDDPSNRTALELRQVARDMRHAKTDEQNRRNYREQWIRTFEELDTLDVIQTDTIVFDDHKRWAEVRDRKPLEFSRLDPVATQDKQVVLDRLESVRFAPKFGNEGQGSPLDEVAAFLQQLTGINFMVSPKVKEELDEDQRTIKLDLPERSVRKVLDLIAETSESLRWKIEDGVVKFVTKDELKGGQVLRTYEVRDLIHPIPDFPAREMNVAPSGGVQITEEEKTARESNVITGEALDALIRNNVAPGSWEADPQNSLRVSNGTMVVHQTPEVHDQIKKLLDDLREATGIMVDIQARFLKVQDTFLEDIGVDFRGLGQPGLGTNDFFNDFGDASTQAELGNEIGNGTDLGAFYDRSSNQEMRARVEELYDTTLGDPNVLTNSGGLSFQWTYLNDLQLQLILRAVSKSERVELVTSPRITVHNTARGNLSVVNHIAYVQDFDVEIAQAASIADPIINIVQDGVTLDVRPVVSADRRFITLELRPTIATLRRPIREITTTLGTQNSVTIQLPEVEYQRVRTSIPMPDGGTVLLGGLKVSDKQDLNSGVPILNKIPIVSFLFDRKGNYVSNRKLLVLLKANIVIPQELEPSPAQIGVNRASNL